MIDLLRDLDGAVLLFLNHTLGLPPGDVIWPLITDYDKLLPVRILLLGIWLVLLVRGGRRGRTVALLVIPVVAIADQLSSSVIKELIGRPRPCHMVDGSPAVQGIRLLVNCGPGKSFPSSHAVNNFAAATLFAWYYRRAAWGFFAWAALVALSRIVVGVHYPSDALGGALIGVAIGIGVSAGWRGLERALAARGAARARERAGQAP